MVVLRLKRMGRTHRPFYRLCAMDKRVACNGRAIEELGWYDPIAPEEKQVSLKMDRVDYWLSVGAQPSETVRNMLKKAGCDPTPGKKYTPPAPPAPEAPAPEAPAATASPEPAATATATEAPAESAPAETND